MFISVASYKKGMGQTITTINLAAIFNYLTKQKSLIIDENKVYKDIEYYLSDSHFTKGLDEYINLKRCGRFKSENDLFSCTKKINKSIDIMTANQCLDINQNDIAELKTYSSKAYKSVFVDTIASKYVRDNMFIKESDLTILLINQEKKIIDEMIEDKFFIDKKDKVVFIINRYIDEFDGVKAVYTENDIKMDLKKAGYNEERVFRLDFDMNIANESNDMTILNYIFNKKNYKSKYYKQLNDIAHYILNNIFNENIEKEEEKNQNLILKILWGKGDTA